MTRPDLWERLARLDQCCDVRAWSEVLGGGRVSWTVRISHRDGRAKTIEVSGQSLVETLSDALTQAEALKWLPGE